MRKFKEKDGMVLISVSDLKKLLSDHETIARKDVLSRVKGYLKRPDWEALEKYSNKNKLKKGKKVVLVGHAKGDFSNTIRVTMAGEIPNRIRQYIVD